MVNEKTHSQCVHSQLKNPTQNGDRNRMLTGIDYVFVVVCLIGIMLLGF